LCKKAIVRKSFIINHIKYKEGEVLNIAKANYSNNVYVVLDKNNNNSICEVKSIFFRNRLECLIDNTQNDDLESCNLYNVEIKIDNIEISQLVASIQRLKMVKSKLKHKASIDYENAELKTLIYSLFKEAKALLDIYNKANLNNEKLIIYNAESSANEMWFIVNKLGKQLAKIKIMDLLDSLENYEDSFK